MTRSEILDRLTPPTVAVTEVSGPYDHGNQCEFIMDVMLPCGHRWFDHADDDTCDALSGVLTQTTMWCLN